MECCVCHALRLKNSEDTAEEDKKWIRMEEDSSFIERIVKEYKNSEKKGISHSYCLLVLKR